MIDVLCMVLAGTLAPSSASTVEHRGPRGVAPLADGIVVRFSGEWDPAFREDVSEDLAAQFARDGLRLVQADGNGSAGALAVVELKSGRDEVVAIEVEVRDAITRKSLRRVIDLGSTTENARSLGLAVSTAELLQASWAELAFQDARPTRDAPPPAPVAASLARRGLRTESARPRVAHELGFSAAAQGAARETLLVGGSLEYGLRPLPRLGIVFGIGGWSLYPIEGVFGRVTGGAFTTTFGIDGALVEEPQGRLELGARLHPGFLATEGHPVPDFTGARSLDFTFDASAVAQGSLRAGGVWLSLSGEVGAMLASVRVQEAGQTVARHAGLRWAAMLGVRVPLAGAPWREGKP